MSKPVSLSIPLVVLVILVSVFAGMESRRVPDWRIELEKYLASRSLSTATIHVRSLARARRPWNYRPEMGRPAVDGTVWGATELPYPPRRVMCVLLESASAARSPTREPAYQVVYVCHHSDALWRMGWVVHESRGDPFAGVTGEQLSSLGCDLQLASLAPEQPSPLRGPDRARDLLPHIAPCPGNS